LHIYRSLYGRVAQLIHRLYVSVCSHDNFQTKSSLLQMFGMVVHLELEKFSEGKHYFGYI